MAWQRNGREQRNGNEMRAGSCGLRFPFVSEADSRSFLPCAGLRYLPCAAPDRRSAFSLIEVAMALGVISFALIGLVGLMPVALDAALDSQRETRAALVARQIFANISISKNGSPKLPSPAEFYCGENGETNDESGNPYTSQTAFFYTRINLGTHIKPNDQIEVIIAAPAAAAIERQNKYIFVKVLPR